MMLVVPSTARVKWKSFTQNNNISKLKLKVHLLGLFLWINFSVKDGVSFINKKARKLTPFPEITGMAVAKTEGEPINVENHRALK